MPVNIGPKIGIDGMTGYKKQMDLIIQQSKELAAEMKAVTSEYDKNDSSQEKLIRQSEVLAKQIDNQKSRISLLEKGYSNASDELSKLAADLYDATQTYGENSKEVEKLQSAYTKQSKTVSKYRTDINNATAVLNGMEKELNDVGAAMNGTNTDADKLSDAIDDVGDAAKDSSGFTVMKGALADLASSGIQTAISAAGNFVQSIAGMAEQTREYRTLQAKMNGSAEAFGYSVDFAREKYEDFYSYLADDQMATNAITNLMGLQVETETVTNLADAAIGVWTAYGDSIPIESLTESMNETAQVGQVTGVLADALNWAGIEEDDFNEKLQSLTTTQERADAIADTLNDTYGTSKDTYDDLTESVRDANTAEVELKDAQAELGDAVEPLDTAFKELQTGALSLITPLVKTVADAFEGLRSSTNEYQDAIYDAITATEDMDEAMKDAIEELEDSTDALKDTMDKIEDGESSTQILVDALDDLSKKSERTADEQYRLESIVTELNSLYPDLGLEIDDTTGSLNKSTDAISDYLKEAEGIELTTEAHSEAARAADALADAEARRSEAAEAAAGVTVQIIEQEKQLQDILDAQEEKNRQRTEAQQAYNEALETGNGNLDELYLAMTDTSEAMVLYDGQMRTVSEAYGLASEKLAQLKGVEDQHKENLEAQNTAVEEAKAALDQYNTAIEGTQASTQGVTDATAAYREGVKLNIEDASQAAEAFSNMSTEQQDLATRLVENVTQMEESMKNTISSQMNLFEQFDASIDLSTDQLLANMKSQVEGVEDWEENIVALSKSGIDDGLLQHLIDMGPSGAGYVQLFANMTEEELKEAEGLWSDAIDIQNLTNTWGEQLKEIGVENIASGMDGVDELLEESGADSVMGLIEGIKNAMADLKAASEEMGETVIDSANTAAGVSSPSWKTKQTGQYIDQGLVEGMRNGRNAVITAAKNVAITLLKDINSTLGTSGGASSKTRTSGRQVDSGLTSGLSAGISSVRSAARNVGRSAISSLDSSLSRSSARASGYNTAIALANGIASGRSAVVSAAANVAYAAISAAQSALQIHSPSRVFLDMGENSVSAFASGFENEQKSMMGRIKDTLDFGMQNAVFASRIETDYGSMSDAIKAGLEGFSAQAMSPININVYARDGQNEREIANIVMDRLQRMVNQREAVFGT